MAALTMHMLEDKYQIKPKFYVRYVDDILVVFNSNEKANIFYKYINSLDPNIKFTYEGEKEDLITFLDVNILKSQGKIDTKWHLKSTNTGTYLHKNSCSPTNHKVSAIRSLINRAYRICSTNELFEKSFKLIFYKPVSYTHLTLPTIYSV